MGGLKKEEVVIEKVGMATGFWNMGAGCCGFFGRGEFSQGWVKSSNGDVT